MSDKYTLKPLAIAAGAALITTLASTSVVNAAENPFAMTELSNGYMVAEMAEGKCGEGKCGGEKKVEKEGKCGEGKCGGDKMEGDKMMEGEKIMEGSGKMMEGKCGEGMMEGEKKAGEGKCGGNK